MTVPGEKIRPRAAAADALRRPERIRDWILLAAPGLLDGLPVGGDPAALRNRRLSLIGGRGLRCACAEALALAARPEVEQIWAYDADFFPQVVATIDGLAYALRNGAEVASLSMGPGKEIARLMRHDPEEPLNRATRAASEAGMVVVAAAGNYGPEAGIVNPWCADWTINVGAATADGGTLAEFSARGLPGETDRPTLVAPGVEIATAHPPEIAKTARQQQREAASPAFPDQTPEELRARRTVVSGTSFATPQAAAMASRVLWVFAEGRRRLEADRTAPQGLVLTAPHRPQEAPAPPRRAGRRLGAGEVRRIAYPFDSFEGEARGRTVKQILVDLARPMPGYGAHEVGAGFVSRALVDAAFGGPSAPEPRILSVKAFLS